jgi:hypothetical protein
VAVSMTKLLLRAALDSAVITIGEFSGGCARLALLDRCVPLLQEPHAWIRSNYNIIADEVKLCGTIRAFKETTRALVHKRMEEICAGIVRFTSPGRRICKK